MRSMKAKFQLSKRRVYDDDLSSGSVDTTSTSDTIGGNAMWTNLLGRSGSFGESDISESDLSFTDLVYYFIRKTKVGCARTCNLVYHHPDLLLWSIVVFAVFCGAGLFIVNSIAQGYIDDRIVEATDMAKTSADTFSEALDRAILPLFSLAQFVFEIDDFRELARNIGQVGKEGSLELLPPRTEGGYQTHRNVTGVCDDPRLTQRFSDIAATIKKNAKMEGVLVNLQLAPMATVCLLHPVNNTEDFENGIFLDNSGAVGHDLLSDPNRKFIAEATIPAQRIVTAGPLSLTQCKGCHPTVERAFIARLPIYMDDYVFDLDGKQYNAWGFAVALINWQELVDRSKMVERFERMGMGFRLTRTDMKHIPMTDTFEEKTVVLSSHNEDLLSDDSLVEIALETTDNEWKMEVGFTHGIEPNWVPGVRVGVVAVSAMLLWLVFLVLVSRKKHQNLLNDIFPPRALRKLNLNETVMEEYKTPTVFFSDIVGYTSLSSEMSAHEVMELLNEFYASMDALADEHDVYKLETVGDAYMVVGGAPYRCTGPEGAEKVARFALAAIEMVESFIAPSGIQIYIRCGLNSGPLVAGVVGVKKPHYTVFGNTVNVASRMESTSIKMKIQCSAMTYQFLKDAPNYEFDLVDRGLTSIKGKGKVNTWWVEGAKERKTAVETEDCEAGSETVV